MEVTKHVPVDYRIADAVISEMHSRLVPLVAEVETRDGYELVRKGIAEVRNWRVQVENRRKELKSDALEYGRRVDSEAKRITALLEAIESPLKLAKQRVDDESERVKREAAEAELRAQAELERKRREAEQAELDRQRAELAQQREALEKQRSEQAAKDREIREAQEKIEREKREAARKELEALERAEFEKQAKLRADREAAEKAERERLAKEREELQQKERERIAAEAAPDIDKLARYADAIQSIETPRLRGEQAMRSLFHSQHFIKQAIDCLMEYRGEFMERQR